MANEASNATNRTINFGFPLFESGDKPSWLVDWNGVMEQLDLVLQDVKNTALSADGEVHNVTAQVNIMHNLVDNLKSEVEVAIADVSVATEDIKTVEEQTKVFEEKTVVFKETVEQDLTSIHTAIDNIATDTQTAITTINADLNSIHASLSQLEAWSTNMGSRVSDAETDIADLKQNDNIKTQQISGLDSRVTTLEQLGHFAIELDDRTNPQTTVAYQCGVIHTDNGVKNLYLSPRVMSGTLLSGGGTTGNSVDLDSGCKIVGFIGSHVDINSSAGLISYDLNTYAGSIIRVTTSVTDGNHIGMSIEIPSSGSAYAGKAYTAHLNVLYYDPNE